MSEVHLNLVVGDVIRHIKRGSVYRVIGRALFSRDLRDGDEAVLWNVDGGSPVITHPDALRGRVNLALSLSFQCSITPPRIGIKGCTKAFVYRAAAGGLVFARPEYEFTSDRFEGPL